MWLVASAFLKPGKMRKKEGNFLLDDVLQMQLHIDDLSWWTTICVKGGKWGEMDEEIDSEGGGRKRTRKQRRVKVMEGYMWKGKEEEGE